MAGLTHNQLIFRDRLASKLGLHKEVVGAWIYHEQNGSAAQSYEKRHYYNWLNIGRTDSGDTGDAADHIWSNPTRAADETVKWIEHRSAPAIRNALKGARGKSPEEQATAIARSPWASSHYGGPQGLISLFKIGGAGDGGGGGTSGGGSTAGSGRARGRSAITVDIPTSEQSESFDQEAYDKAKKLSILGAYLKKKNPNNSLLRAGVLSDQAPDPGDFTTTKTTVGSEKFTIPGTGSEGGGGSSSAGGSFGAEAFKRASQLDAKHFKYLWGGGHGTRLTAGTLTPVDCSGAVSYVTGVNPRVASQFEKWGRPGEGGDVTVYAKDTHVLMKIRDPKTNQWRFFGTSGSNPGGGAGWIPASAVSADYLKGFTVRHSER